MADSFELNLGSLRSQMSITLHTHHAAIRWFGRRPQADDEGNKRPIIGMPRFISIMDQIKAAAAQNDPYADFWLIKMEERLARARQEIAALQSQVNEVLKQIPPAITVEDNVNIQPLRLPLFIGCQLGYIGIYLLTEFDTVARGILLIHHTGLIGRREMEQWLDRGAHEVRSVLGLAQQYRHAGVTRDDMAANNARARDAIEKFGVLPQEILEGTLRSNYAPALPQLRGGSGTAADHNDGADDSGLEQSIGVEVEGVSNGA
ncbi:PFL_4669 family integrating conjugative element protein [Pseudomonas lopnurensis]|uniref:PFL_4669 family integrating conjugative element protein n=1 Tax=Pseudomonas lopnurensis TaxID=1477517 RepID=UPI0028B058D9|nr:TIGR03761 family integrating conjugative element protein [Pseudomonas lopnurensis]